MHACYLAQQAKAFAAAEGGVAPSVSKIDAKLADQEKMPPTKEEGRAWERVSQRIGKRVKLDVLTQRDRLQVLRG